MKKIFKWLGIILLFLILIIVGLGYYANEAKPTNNPTPKADAMAQKMLRAINNPAWDTTQIVQWTFRGEHDYLWDKSRNFVQVVWNENKVLLHTKTVSGKAFKNGKEVTGDEDNELVQTAWAYFCNDSFWLNAPAKAFDSGTSRSIVTVKDGREGLMVSYDSGGVTPGDSYVWFLNDEGLPTSYKMWVSIIPIGGLEFTWEDWTTLESGAKVAQLHKSSALEIPITNLKSGVNLGKFGDGDDPFEVLN